MIDPAAVQLAAQLATFTAIAAAIAAARRVDAPLTPATAPLAVQLLRERRSIEKRTLLVALLQMAAAAAGIFSPAAGAAGSTAVLGAALANLAAAHRAAGRARKIVGRAVRAAGPQPQQFRLTLPKRRIK